MMLYERDFRTLTPEEEEAWRTVQEEERVDRLGRFEITRPLPHRYPPAVRHYLSLFPNNFLDTHELHDEQHLRATIEDFRALLDSTDVTERKVINHVRDKRAYLLIASLLKAYYSFGHHEAHIFPEFQLGTSHKVDYLLAGANSDGWHLVFVELEAPRGDGITLASGDLGSAFRKGLAQIADWDSWLDAHFGSLAETFDKCRTQREALPREFRLLDKSRLHYAVVAGRRADFNDKTYQVRRKRAPTELIVHYDNILDAAAMLVGSPTY